MGEIVIPEKALLIAGVLHNDRVGIEEVEAALTESFGKILVRSVPFEFTQTDYYREEMGSPLTRVYYGMDRLIGQDGLVAIKRESNRLEKERFSSSGKRNVNIDTGYLTFGKVVLASTKNNQHRLYLGEGIWAEVTLRYRNKTYTPWEWTFRDYRMASTIRFFNDLRSLYREMPNP